MTSLADYRESTFSALEAALTVELIATPTEDLVTCDAKTPADTVTTDPLFAAFDFVPVQRDGAIVGVFDKKRSAATFSPVNSCESVCDAHCMKPLSEDNIISANSGILAFIESADRHPCRLLVKGTRLAGIVTVADALKLPARPAFFLIVTHVELLMGDAIRNKFGQSDAWLDVLNKNRRKRVVDHYKYLKNDNLEPLDKLTATMFCDKRDIFLSACGINVHSSKKKCKSDLRKVERLRNFIAHADHGNYTPGLANNLIETVQIARKWIRFMEQASMSSESTP